MSLDDIAEEIGVIEDEQEDSDGDKIARGGSDEFDPEDYERDKNEYEGGW